MQFKFATECRVIKIHSKIKRKKNFYHIFLWISNQKAIFQALIFLSGKRKKFHKKIELRMKWVVSLWRELNGYSFSASPSSFHSSFWLYWKLNWKLDYLVQRAKRNITISFSVDAIRNHQIVRTFLVLISFRTFFMVLLLFLPSQREKKEAYGKFYFLYILFLFLLFLW